MQAAIANHLNVAESAVIRVETWFNCLFAVVKGIGARFVSKSILSTEKTIDSIDLNPDNSINQQTIEFVQGNESHSSYWGKYYVKGLEQYQVKEDFDENRYDRHHSYQGYVCCNVPDGVIFTIFEQNGSKRGTDTFLFSICETDSTEEIQKDKAEYGKGFFQGQYKVIAQGKTKTLAPRLLDWWTSGDKTKAYAELCAKYIDKRGVKNLPIIY